MATITGDGSDETLNGTNTADAIWGRAGNDTLYGNDGNDSLYGEEGNDFLYGGNGNDTLVGGAGGDYLDGGAGIDWAWFNDLTGNVEVRLYAGSVWSSAGGETILNIENVRGTNSNDYIEANGLDNVIEGGAGADGMFGGQVVNYQVQNGIYEIDTLSYRNSNAAVTVNLAAGTGVGGHAQGDVFEGFEAVWGSNNYGDTIIGDSKTNYFEGFGGADTFDGAGGSDWVFYNGNGTAVTVDLGLGGIGGNAQGDVYISIENIRGTSAADTLTGDANDNVLAGGGGADTLDGGAGSDWASYEFATATVRPNLATGLGVSGEASNDVYLNIENLRGGSANDTLTGNGGDNILEGMGGADSLVGGGGFDFASYRNARTAVTADLSNFANNTGDATGDRYNSIEGLIGSDYNDTLTGDGNDNLIRGGKGFNLIASGAGNDTIVAGEGFDTIDGGAGIDLVDFSTSAGHIEANLNTVTWMGALGGWDWISNVENLRGTTFGDSIVGNWGDNVFEGMGGADALYADHINNYQVQDNPDAVDTVSYRSSDAGVTLDFAANTGAGGHAQGDIFYGFENAIGSTHADTILGDAKSNSFEGLAGADAFDGRGGSDWATYVESDAAVQVDLGLNVATGGHALGDTFASIENLRGSAFADMLTGDSGANMFDGGLGADSIVGGAGSDTVTYAAATAAVQIDLAAGTTAGAAIAVGDVLVGIENVRGTSFADTLIGDAADNTFEGGVGTDTLTGGAGFDIASYANAASAVTASLAAPGTNTGDAAGDVYSGIEGLRGSNFADELTGDAFDNFIEGLLGGDTLSGGDGNDTLSGGGNSDIIYGGNGTDTVSFATAASGGDIRLSNWVANAWAGDWGALMLGYDIENAVGTAFADSVSGNGSNNVIEGGGGADGLYGDGFNGGVPVDNPAAYDTLAYRTSDAGVNVNLATGAASGGHAQGDSFSGFEGLIGSRFADTLTGDAKNNGLEGYGGADTFGFLDGFGTDTILDFGVAGAEKDTIDLSAVTGVNGLGDLVLAQSGADTTVDVAGQGTIVLLNTLVGDLDASHFVF